MEANAPVLPVDAGAQTRVCTMVFLFSYFPFPLYHPFLRPVKLTMLGGERGMKWLAYLLAAVWLAAFVLGIIFSLSNDWERRTDGPILIVICLLTVLPIALICLVLSVYC